MVQLFNNGFQEIPEHNILIGKDINFALAKKLLDNDLVVVIQRDYRM